MKNRIITFATILVLLTAVSCQKKEERNYPGSTNSNGSNNHVLSRTNNSSDSSASFQSSFYCDSGSDAEDLRYKESNYYYNLIDPLSDDKYDYQNPISANVLFMRYASSYFYRFTGSKAYELISCFDNVLLDYVEENSFTYTKICQETPTSILIHLSCALVDAEDEKNETVTLYILEDGTLCLFCKSNSIIYCSKPASIEYDAFEAEVLEKYENIQNNQ